jgi:hypothetical protein
LGLSVGRVHTGKTFGIKANGGAIGRPPFGYRIEGAKLHKKFVIDPVTGPWVREAFKRIANGRNITSVALWLTEATGFTWRLKRVTDMIKRMTAAMNRKNMSLVTTLAAKFAEVDTVSTTPHWPL